MKIVIQCAATKTPTPPGAGFRTVDNRLVKFVACVPDPAPQSLTDAYAHPDHRMDGRQTWRERLLAYNKEAPDNPLGLLPAYQIYTNPVYADLVARWGPERVFILSAGWGLIPASFLTPEYDITYSGAKKVTSYARRRKDAPFDDFCLLPDDGDDVIFLGGKDYLPLFVRLTMGLKGRKKVFYRTKEAPLLGPGFSSQRCDTDQRTNWHYRCAQGLIDGTIKVLWE